MVDLLPQALYLPVVKGHLLPVAILVNKQIHSHLLCMI
ncbi:hypothetical protein MM3A0810R_1732 [Mycobacteroides abscessus 3A-0810-R]|nr:hypothetical protein MA3A0930R_1772 [Mycobacteroides abscessus 3A-0930-R]EIV82042.1 hypothetical protein MM3A0810R_1732 [Mycobacteroides abscessus 3A-0810-R]